MSDRGLAADVSDALESVRADLAPYWGAFTVPISVVFAAANTKQDVAHGLGQVPDGYHLVRADGVVHAEPGVQWTKDLAYMRATAVNVRATIIFFTLRETPNEA